MKRLYLLIALLVIPFSISFAQQEDPVQNATVAYDQGNFSQAIDIYESLIATYGTSPELYYNLGNAYFKDKNYAKAILNYERCLIYDPGNSDASVNLEFAKANCVDKIEEIQPIIFKSWFNAISNTMSCNTWSIVSITFFLVFVVCIFGYFFGKQITIRKTGFYLGIVMILLCLISNLFANHQKNRIMIRDYAIVMSPTVTVKSSPAESGTQLFTIHEGLKVKVRSTLGDWSEVELSDGNVGWLPSVAIEKI